MNNKIPIIITIITLFIITFFTFSNTGQFTGIVLESEDEVKEFLSKQPLVTGDETMMLTLFNLLDKHQLTQKSDFDYDGVSDVEECPALKILLLDIKKEGIGDLRQIGDLDSKININSISGMFGHYGGNMVPGEGIKELNQDCLVSAWSEWSECKGEEPFGFNVSRERSRTILTKPQGKGKQCPILFEKERCFDDENATLEDDNKVPEKDIILGCTNQFSINYNPDATEDDGSCQPNEKVTNFLKIECPDSTGNGPDWLNPYFPPSIVTPEEPETEEETEEETELIKPILEANLDVTGDTTYCKAIFNPQADTTYDSAVLITQVTVKTTNEVQDYTYKIMNNIDSDDRPESTLPFNPARETCEVFLWEDFSGKAIAYKKYVQVGFSNPEPGPSEFPELDPSTGGNLADGPSLNLGGAQTAL